MTRPACTQQGLADAFCEMVDAMDPVEREEYRAACRKSLTDWCDMVEAKQASRKVVN